jgi:iron complex outermembrane receptor protein
MHARLPIAPDPEEDAMTTPVPPLCRLARALACLPWAAPLAWAAPAALAQDITTLPAVSARSPLPPRLEQAASTGSNLGMTPLETPASVDAITRAQLDARGDTSLAGAITRSAGIGSLAHPGNSGSSLSARGFTDTTSVMRLYDGMRQYGGVGVSFPFDTWAIERIEVLRGPASVIHGDGAIGGVVNVIPRKPVRGPIRHEIQALLGTDGQRALAVDSSGALSEQLSYRFDASGERSDGWVDRGESRQRAFSGAVRLDVSPALNLTLSHAQGKQAPMRYFGTPLVNGALLPALREKNDNVADSAITYRDRWTDLSAHWAPDSRVAVRTRLYHVESWS